METIKVRMPKYPECWQSCGSCASGAVFILELLVKVGDVVARDDNLLTLLSKFTSPRAIRSMRARSW